MMKSRILFLGISLVLLFASIAFAKTEPAQPTEVFLQGQEMEDGSIRYEGTNGEVAVEREWHPSKTID